jgi:hypothetical protein
MPVGQDPRLATQLLLDVIEPDQAAVVLATLEPPPEKLGVTHWSSRLLASQLGISNVWVARIWRRWGLQPWRRLDQDSRRITPALQAR